ncbi:hypothetical protein [Emticicia aquatilis]|uniref:hypothetical protein n=1 Tax=Emticicia aquatilis TaxID=1537369 RepID=UPI00166664EB|nr:hypothetical protein [Emticicia aquatilis]
MKTKKIKQKRIFFIPFIYTKLQPNNLTSTNQNTIDKFSFLAEICTISQLSHPAWASCVELDVLHSNSVQQ